MEEEKNFWYAAAPEEYIESGGGFLFSDEDIGYMVRALELASRGRGFTRPNPMVGAVLVKNGRIVGEGWHREFGGPHAEVEAIESCHISPKGATLYVTLEPCAHYGKTPPCADMLIKNGIGRVVAAMVDPNPLVSGKGIEKLKAAGIPVTVGVLEAKARKLNEAFIKYVTERKPFVIYKSAMSLDGKIACKTGDSKWISCEVSRMDAHRLRGECAGILVGVDTVIADDPLLTTRIEGLPDPVRIVADSRLRIPLDAKLLHEKGRVIILTTEKAPRDKRIALQKLGADLIIADTGKGRVDLQMAMTGLAMSDIDSVLLEGGPTLAAGAFEAGIVDKVITYVAPMLIGGKEAPGAVGGTGAAHPADAVKLRDISYETSGTDVKITAYTDREAADVHGNH